MGGMGAGALLVGRVDRMLAAPLAAYAVVEALRPVFLWDRLYIGGGNSRRIRPEQLERMGDDVVVVPNTAGIVGGVRAWSIQGTNGLPHAS